MNNSFLHSGLLSWKSMVKGSVCGLLVSLLFAVPVHAQREMRSFNEGWLFSWESDNNASMVSIPHTWNTDAYTLKDYKKGKALYRKVFTIPQEWNGRQLFLKLDAASKECSVRVDGKEVGTHQGGYTAALFALNDAIDKGKQGHLMEISVSNATDDVPPISGDFTFFGGIYRDTWLIATNDIHFSTTDLSTHGVYVHAHDVSAKAATVSVRCNISNESTKKERVTLQTELFSPDGQRLAVIKNKASLPSATNDVAVNQTIKVDNPVLWTPETPHLYKVVTTVIAADNRTVLDTEEHVTAMRWCEYDADKGFFLNGKQYKLRGMCRHQDQWPMGVALDEEQHRRDFRLMKEMGCNFLRIAHYPQDDALLELCDREGMLVWEEIPVIDIVPDNSRYADNAEHNLREMIRQHYNHPSVIMWGYMNEILLKTMRQYKDETALAPVMERTLALAKRLEKAVDEEDPWRVSTMAFHGSNDYNTRGLSTITDVVGWNLYQGWYGSDMNDFERFLQRQHEQQPTHPMIVSEYGAGSDHRLHSLHPHAFDFSSEYQQLYLEHYLPVIEDSAYVLGATHWNFIDFASALRDESMPRINNKGLVRNDRTPKDVYYYYKAAWRKDISVVHVASRDWQWRTAETDANGHAVMPVKVYANTPTVELLIDGRSLGEKKVENCTAVFNCPFGDSREPLLTARGKADGKVVGEDAVRIHFTPAGLTSEHQELAVNVGSECYYTSDHSQLTWVADKPYTEGSWGYIGGNEKQTQTEIHGTREGPLFQTWREGGDGYRFDVANGTYEIEVMLTKDMAAYDGGEAAVYLLGRADTAKGLSAERHRYTQKVDDGRIIIPLPQDAHLCGIIIRKK